MQLTFANKITIARILVVPFFIATVLYYVPERDHLRYAALAIFLFAVISDVLDGFIARTYHQKTRSGAILDPLADKLLLMSSFICLYKVGVNFPVIRFPIWLVVTVISRDVILLIGSMLIYILTGRLNVEPTVWGKVSTLFQGAVIICMLLQWPWSVVLWYGAVLFAVLSGVDYIRYGIKVMNAPANRLDPYRSSTDSYRDSSKN